MEDAELFDSECMIKNQSNNEGYEYLLLRQNIDVIRHLQYFAEVIDHETIVSLTSEC